MHARWVDGRDIGDADELVRIAAAMDLDPALAWPVEDLPQPAGDEPATRRLREATQEAIAKGVFGSPTCVVDDQLFWGVDRLWMLDRFLADGERYRKLPPGLADALLFA